MNGRGHNFFKPKGANAGGDLLRRLRSIFNRFGPGPA